MAKQTNILIKWLRDAHAMEASAESNLNNVIARMKDYPRMHQRLMDHLEETRRQHNRLERCIEQLGGDTSMVQEMVGKFSGTIRGFAASGTDNDAMKMAISMYQFECMEVATYRALITAAEIYAQPEVVRICQEILVEEEQMVRWMDEHLEEITHAYLSKQGVGLAPPMNGASPERRSPPPM